MHAIHHTSTPSRASAWLLAARPRTLPLACASIFLGSGLAVQEGGFQTAVLVLALVTAILLQVLSNLANDYGDAVSGADDERRIGPQRAVASGLLSLDAMRRGMWVAASGAAIAGLLLVWQALGADPLKAALFLLFGVIALAAAVTYTVGVRHYVPYGYRGLGDLAVFVFFGLLGVLGTAYLHAQTLSMGALLPAVACGLLCAAVLNVNNVRDIESDAQSGKITLAIRLGRRRAIGYHWGLLAVAFLATLAFLLLYRVSWLGWGALAAWAPLIKAPMVMAHCRDGATLTAMLKLTALATLAYSVLLSAGLVLGG
ncbi:1,4-dihydroxy-2-naphthoate octaprenyltransferase [Halomonas dongshanensis]|uniref:1,4-dihydroxy-2-naphthoate octaprenyltransferase n=1 Tax=Halomonas dongshanensis TaxID=2890835 RepID=A0ABT2EK81_9GAMM|nr:1,4-dihydroxy-2-naphthoate octaprenyltransferase [Halomonas dongshanensis]MCS2610987.1 1,4-dihydroxy-2-naphthoate octaprenyltransferase [Halomonas dongshanensis]